MKFRLRRQRPIRRTICKLFAFHLARCRSLVSGGDEAEPGRIHEARKSVKRLRALISLVRKGLGADARWFDRRLRDVNRTLSPVRDAHALREAMDQLIAADVDHPDELAHVRARLLAWTDQRERLPPEAGQSVLRQLDDIETRWKRSRLDGRGWSLLECNIRRAYRRARKATLSLFSSAPTRDFHELRKLVKQTQYHWEFLEPLWSDRLRSELNSLESLTETLGRLHDAVLLANWIAAPEQVTLPQGMQRLVMRRLKRQQHEFQRAACRLAPRCFAEKPRNVLARLQRYWQSWRRDKSESIPSAAHFQSTALPADRP